MQLRLESECFETWMHMCQYAYDVHPWFDIGRDIDQHAFKLDGFFNASNLNARYCIQQGWMRVIVFNKGPLAGYNNTHSSRMHWKSIQFECMLTNLRVPRALRHSCVRDTELWAHIVSKLTDVRAFRLQAWLRAEITLAHFKIHGVSIKNHLFQIVYAARHALKHPL